MARHMKIEVTEILNDFERKEVELPKYCLVHLIIGEHRFDIDTASGEHGPVLNISSPNGGLVVQPIVSNSINVKVGKI